VPRFVILEHTGTPTYKPGRHWDLMLEFDGRLRTWELEAAPEDGATIRATGLPDHRLHYLDYEGPVSAGRGAVHRWDSGSFQLLSETEDQQQFSLDGARLKCRLRLDRDSFDRDQWLASFETPESP
jgi:hypothetical protein